MCESKALRHGPLFLVLGRQKQEDLWSWLASQSSLSANFTERLYLEKYDGKAMEEDSKQRLWPPHVHTKIHKHPPTPTHTTATTTTLSHKIRQILEAELIFIDLTRKSHKQPPT